MVNAGSVLEDDDQRGLAHFVEHMAFNGTKHFPKQDVIAFLQSTGMRFGAHINANTSFDQTVYELQIPTDSPAVIDRSLLILEDWAHAVSFEPAEIDKERGVILEEWRTGLGAGARILDAQLPVLLKDSRYAERLPIGKPEIIRTFSYDRLKKFYTDWYRPDLMAVIVVGDFDPAAMETLIKSHFGSIPAAASPRPRPVYDVPDQPGTRYTIATDPEATRTTVGVSSTMSARDQSTLGAYRQQTIERMFSRRSSPRGCRRWRRSPARRFWPRRPTEASSSSPPKPRRSSRSCRTAASRRGSRRSLPKPIASPGSASRRPSSIATG